MADIALVITINKTTWKNICDSQSVPDMLGADIVNGLNSIKNGTRLPTGHGRLKDIDAFITKVKADRKHSAYLKSWTADDVLNALDNSYAPTIIKSDKEVLKNE